MEFEDGIEVICTKWAIFNDSDNAVFSFFPLVTSKTEMKQLLQENKEPDQSWTDENNTPWPIKKFLCYASKYTKHALILGCTIFLLLRIASF